MDSSRPSYTEFVLPPHAVQLLNTDLKQVEQRLLAMNQSLIRRFFNTDPPDKERAQQAIIDYHTGQGLGLLTHSTQFIWCASPQTAIVMAKVLSDLHEGTRPERPSGMRPGPGAKIHRPRDDTKFENLSEHFETRTGRWSSAGHRVLSSRTLRVSRNSSRRGGNDFTALGNVLDQISVTLKFNPDTSFVTEGGGSGKDADLLEIALKNSDPYLSDIQLTPEFYGRRLDLLGSWTGHQALETCTEGTLEYELAQSCGWVWDYGPYVIMCERPIEVHYEEQERLRVRLSSTTRPAMAWRDGFSVYCINGVLVPDFVVMHPERITRWAIQQTQNQEVRRIMMDRYKPDSDPPGIAAYLLDSQAKRIDHDEQFGTLYRLNQPREEDIVMLEVINRSPELDGSFKHYFLRVPPQISSAHAAAAWTFGLTPEEYFPVQET